MKLDPAKTRVYCLFEQSGTFKRAFMERGFRAYDYDIQNKFGETDCVMDVFKQIEAAYFGMKSIFDGMEETDLIMAFFPCIYFCDPSQCAFRISHINYRKLQMVEIQDKIIERNRNREYYFRMAVKMCFAALIRKIPLIMENPWSGEHYLKNNFLKRPDIIDTDRTKRGDHFKKPTAYWFFGCEPTHAQTAEQQRDIRRVYDTKAQEREGLCSMERSMITPEYARNFIADFILGSPAPNAKIPQQGDLF